MTEQEHKAIEMALDVLENYVSPFIRHEDRHDNAIQALRQALAQPEQKEWVGLTDEEFKHFKFYAPPEIVWQIEDALRSKNT